MILNPRYPLGLLMFICLLLGGCSQQLQRQTCVTLSNNIDYCLAPLNDQVKQDAHSQMVQFTHEGKSHQLITELQIDNQTMTLVGLAPLGQPLFTIVYDGHTLVSQQSSLLGQQFKAEYLMAILQLVYWPTETVNQHISAGTWAQKQCGSPLCRQLVEHGNEPVLTAEYSHIDPWQAAIDIRIAQANVQIKIQALQ